MNSITLQDARDGIRAAWSHLDTLDADHQYDAMSAAFASAEAANDQLIPLPTVLPTLVAALERDGWEISVDPHHPNWREAAGNYNTNTNHIEGLTSHCQRRILLKTARPLARVLRTALHETGHAWGQLTANSHVCRHAKPSPEKLEARLADDFMAEILGRLPTHLVENETEAELTALIVGAALGFNPTSSFYYLAPYRQRGWQGPEHFDLDVLPRAWASACEVAERILAELQIREEVAA